MRTFPAAAPALAALAALGACAAVFSGCRDAKDAGPLRVSMPLNKPASYYDPARTRRAFGQYFFLENTYTPLLEYTPDGKLVSALAEHFELRGSDAHFRIRRGAVTAGGRELDAYDAEASLKRLFILDRETHGALEAALCGGRHLAGLADACPGIRVLDGGRSLQLSFSEPRPLIFQTLAAPEFSVVPRSALDPATLAIADYRETSGPYYVDSDDGAGNIVLKANPRHFHYSPAMPDRVALVPYSPESGETPLKMLLDGRVDHVTTLERIPCDEMIDFAAAHRGEVTLHRTYPIKLFVVTFTSKGLKELTARERWETGQALKKIHNSAVLSRSGYEPAGQVFTLEGTLPESALKAIEAGFGRSASGPVTSKDILGWDGTGTIYAGAAALAETLPGLKLMKVHKNPNFTDFRKEKLPEPHFYVGGYNVGLQDDIGLISYHMNAGTLLPEKGTKEEWLLAYSREADKARRFEMMRALQYSSLERAVSVPMATVPYAALVRKPWKFGMPRHHAGNQIWRIYRD